MLKLKYLFANLDLANMMVQNFEHDDLDIMKYYMISSNAIYPFKNKEEVKFLRLAPNEAKTSDQIEAEIEILKHLKNKEFPAIRPVKSLKDKYIIKHDTPFGEYYATVFDRVLGECVEELKMTEHLAKVIGKSLAKLHCVLSSHKSKRETFFHKFKWMEKQLDLLNDNEVIDKLLILKSDFSKLELTEENYGLIHYDYELDNIYYHKDTDTIYPIDFDDSMYHLYSMDIFQTLNSFEDKKVEFAESFISAYESIRPLPINYKEEVKLCERFASIYSYTRISRSASETWDNEPKWLVNLRVKFENVKKDKIELM